MNLVDVGLIENYIADALNKYHNESFVKLYLERLYERLQNDECIDLRELKGIQGLREYDKWQAPVQAVERIHGVIDLVDGAAKHGWC